MRRKIVYITSEWFADTDINVLSELAKIYDIIWIMTINLKNPRLDIHNIKEYATVHEIDLHLVDAPYKYLDPRNLIVNWKILKIIRYNNDVDLCIKISTQLYWLLLSWLLPQKKLVYGFHDVLMHSGIKGRKLVQSVFDVTIKYSRSCFFYSHAQHEYFLSKWKDKNTCHVGMSTKDFGEPSVKRPPIRPFVKLLFFGRIEEYKGLDLLIDALENLKERGIDNIRLSVYGTGPFWQKCLQKIRTASLYNLDIRFINNDEIPNIMEEHHFLVLPYRDTTQSGPLYIAANYSLPVLCPAYKSFMEIYNQDTAVVYQKGALEEALLKISQMPQEEYDKKVECCHKLKEMFSKGAVSKRMATFFDKIIFA